MLWLCLVKTWNDTLTFHVSRANKPSKNFTYYCFCFGNQTMFDLLNLNGSVHTQKCIFAIMNKDSRSCNCLPQLASYRIGLFCRAACRFTLVNCWCFPPNSKLQGLIFLLNYNNNKSKRHWLTKLRISRSRS